MAKENVSIKKQMTNIQEPVKVGLARTAILTSPRETIRISIVSYLLPK